MLPWASDLNGRLDELTLASEALRGNPLGDPHVRPVWVHVPPSYDVEATRRFPVVYVLMGYGGILPTLRIRQPYATTTIEVVDALLSDPDVPPFIAVYQDCWTSYGCGQYVDSPGTGR